VLACIAYYQPITRGELSSFFGKEVSRDLIGALRSLGFIAAGPRSPTPGAPYTYVTTKEFLSHFGFDTSRDLPDMEALEDAGLLSKDRLLAGEFPAPADLDDDDDEISDPETPESPDNGAG
jgi:segregation and condensation protein B